MENGVKLDKATYIGLAMLGLADAVVEKLNGGLRMIDDT
jgi:hypothetical protein